MPPTRQSGGSPRQRDTKIASGSESNVELNTNYTGQQTGGDSYYRSHPRQTGTFLLTQRQIIAFLFSITFLSRGASTFELAGLVQPENCLPPFDRAFWQVPQCQQR